MRSAADKLGMPIPWIRGADLNDPRQFPAVTWLNDVAASKMTLQDTTTPAYALEWAPSILFGALDKCKRTGPMISALQRCDRCSTLYNRRLVRR